MYIPATDNVVKGYEIANSLRFNDNDSAYLSRTPASAGNRKTWTWAGWVKRSAVSGDQNVFASGTILNNWTECYYGSSGKNLVFRYGTTSTQLELATDAFFRDPSAWYHIVIKLDTTQATSTERVKIYINGNEQAVTVQAGSYPSQNANLYFNNNVAHYLARRDDAAQYLDAYLADVHFIDGQALGPENFGETGDYGEWKPIQYTGTYGTNGFYLDFEASGDLGNDVSGNGNDWTPTNLAATDQMIDTPTNNFATLNVLDLESGLAIQEGNLELDSPSTSFNSAITGSFGMSSGKWYWEVAVTSVGAIGGTLHVGIIPESNVRDLANYYNYSVYNGQFYDLGTGSAYGSSSTTGDIIGVAYDADAGSLTFYKNNSSLGVAKSGLSGSFLPCYSDGGGNNYSNYHCVTVSNFGQDSSFAGNKTAQGNTDDNGIGDFYYSPPSGYLALCTANLSDPSIIPSEHFNTVLYTGTGADNHSITGVGFSPEMLWIKNRSSASSHNIFDIVRGVGKKIIPNLTNAESTAGEFESFDADGFTLDWAQTDNNASGNNYVVWNWKANGAGVSNTDGSITSTVSANVDAGFSIVSYTGTGNAETVGHGLTEAPELVIYKDRDLATSWGVGCDSIGWTKYLHLDLANAEAVGARFNNTAPTASVFSIGAGFHTNGNNHIAYCFHSVDGFSKFGSYTGNGSTDGPFVFTNFKPKYVMIKRTDSTASWSIFDTERSTFNVIDDRLVAQSSDAELTGNSSLNTDILSNGFKLRNNYSDYNANGGSYIYMAFAESPFANTNAK